MVVEHFTVKRSQQFRDKFIVIVLSYLFSFLIIYLVFFYYLFSFN